MEIGKWKLAQAWIHHPEPKDSRGVWDDLVKVANAEWEAKEQAFMGTITPEFDELSPREEQYYQKPPFSTNEVFLGSKGGVPQLVQPGPGRQGYAESKASTKTFSKHALKMKDAVIEYNELITDAVKKKDLSEISDFHNWYKKKTGKTFNTNNYDYHVGASDFPQRKLLRDVRIGLASDLMDEANATNKHISRQKIVDKLGLKRIPGSAGGQEELVEIFERYVPTEKKIQNYFDDMFMDFDKPADDVLSPKIRITEEFGVDRKIVDRVLNNYKNFKDMKPMMTRLSRAAFMKKIKGKNWTIGDVNKAVQSGTFFKRTNAIENQLMDLGARHVNQGGDLIQFYKDGKPLRDLGDLTSWDGVSFKSRSNNKVAFGKKEYGLGGDLTNKNYVDLQLGGRKDPLFKEYFTQVDELDNLRKRDVQYPKGHPKAGKWTTFDQLMKETYNRASGYSYKRFPYELDHFGSIKNNPFGNIQILPRRINQAAGTINFWVPEADKAKYLERIKYKQTNLEDLVKTELKFAEDTLVFDKKGNWIGKKTVPLHKEAKEFFTKTGQKIPKTIRGGPTLSSLGAGVLDDLVKSPGAKKAIRGLGWLLGPLDVVLEGGMALPALARGNPQMARRSTTPGVFGSYGGTMLEDIRKYNRGAYRYAKATKDINEWNALEEDIQRAQKVISGEIGGYPEVAKTDLAEAKKKQALLEKNFSPTQDKDFQAFQDTMSQMAKDSREWSGDKNWLGQERGEQSTQESLEAAGVKPIDAHMMMQNADTTDEWRKRHQLEELDYELGGLNVETFLDPYGLKTQDPRYSDLPTDIASDYGSWEANQVRQKLEQLQNIDPGAAYAEGGIAGLLKK
jgi:hypothetical protein